jgi:hypothetical protein
MPLREAVGGSERRVCGLLRGRRGAKEGAERMRGKVLSGLGSLGVGAITYALAGGMFGTTNVSVIIGSLGLTLLFFCATQMDFD